MKIFVYGTLQSKALLAAVAGGDPIESIDAQLAGHRVLPVARNVVPLIRAEAGAVTSGVVLQNIAPDQLRRLDAYEGAFDYGLIDVTVSSGQGDIAAKMYLPPDDIAVGDGDWSLAHWVTHFEAMAVNAATELFLHDRVLTAAQIVAQWPMMETRAWAKASATDAPADVRYAPQAGDVTVTALSPPMGSFFRLQQMQLQHRQFDGTTSAVLDREVFMGVDAVLVLPYDVARDRILLVEQIRMGPVLRGARNPWSLEPIAGMIDATETPVQAAHRESAEEAGLVGIDLRHLSSFYPSPGSSTDFFHAYLGLCDLPDDHAAFGGLDYEAEDLRLHLVSYEKAMALVGTGEINTGPLVMMLAMLGAQRNGLRNRG